ncbi:hypothetical protein BJ122_102209 [Rhodopseudomonas faecalis]|uniref:Uncharacterized protein n=1 Tax=Rhodopseudomonas faecalis TaxID=99655 RepID=A0A318TKP7_9BRAD|nr:hypothetical protein [Rhodopseudomonas faecalis]PYF04983.1 hypothetical protein BJ122_102209 [Rhodopseudomonas faecalis]
MNQRSKTVSSAIGRGWASIASKMMTYAMERAKEGDGASAATAMLQVEVWLDKAGADATRYHFTVR